MALVSLRSSISKGDGDPHAGSRALSSSFSEFVLKSGTSRRLRSERSFKRHALMTIRCIQDLRRE